MFVLIRVARVTEPNEPFPRISLEIYISLMSFIFLRFLKFLKLGATVPFLLLPPLSGEPVLAVLESIPPLV